MDELTIDGKVFVSSKKAAALSGYAKDYVGQLCREGRVESKLVGRSWYVYEPSIREHRFNDERSKGKGLGENADAAESKTSENTNIQAVWQQPAYTAETFETMPVLSENEPVSAPIQEAEAPKAVSEMQSTWQEWFSERSIGSVYPQQRNEPQAPVYERQPVVQPVRREEPVPVRMIVSDIEPIKPYKTEERPVPQAFQPIAIERPVQGRVLSPREETHQVPHPRKRHKQNKNTSVITKAFLIGVIVVVASIALVSTGLVDELHLTGVSNSSVLQYLQGSSVVNK